MVLIPPNPGGLRSRGPVTRPLRYSRMPTGEHIAREHPDRQFVSLLCTVFLNHQGKVEVKAALREFAGTIRSGGFTVFFDQGEVEDLFIKEVLAPRGYNSPADLRDEKAWQDLVHNVGAGFCANATLAVRKETVALDGKTRTPTKPQQRTLAGKDVALNKRAMKIIEDWLFYHQDVLQQIIA